MNLTNNDITNHGRYNNNGQIPSSSNRKDPTLFDTIETVQALLGLDPGTTEIDNNNSKKRKGKIEVVSTSTQTVNSMTMQENTSTNTNFPQVRRINPLPLFPTTSSGNSQQPHIPMLSNTVLLELRDGNYAGGWKKGEMDGEGIFTYNNGDIYKGDWERR